MSNRYRNRQTFINDDELYDNVLEARGVRKIRQYSTPKIPKLTPRERASIKTTPHVWGVGDKYYKLASKYYNDPTYWWVIAQYNFAPTEAHLSPGMVIKIPISLEEVMRFYR